jgi:Zn-dependent protease
MFARSVRLTRIAGIDVRLDSSLLLFAVLIAWVFGANFLASHGMLVTVPMAVVATVLFLSSVLAHELAHGLEARYRGIRVHGITLFFFGGMTEMRADSRGPRDEFAVSAVGPYASLVCAAVFGLIAAFAPVLAPAVAAPVADVAGLLAWLNLFLAAFNLVPGAPLDGGRVLRAGLWWLLGDRHRAVRISGRAGQVLAAGLVTVGVWALVVGLGLLPAPGPDAPAVARMAESPVLGIVLLMVGAFIFQAARAELAQGEVEHVLDQRRVAELVTEPVPLVDHDRPLDLVDPGPGDRLLPVVDGLRVVGVLPAARVRELHPADRAARTAGEVMDPAAELADVDEDAPLRELVDRLLDGSDQVVVRAGDRPVAVLREAEVARGLRRLRRDRGGRRAVAAQTQGSAT